MTLKVIVFDFDGTLIDSNRLKHEAFFKLFPDDAHHARTVREALAQIGEASRYEIIEKILAGLGRRPTGLQGDVNALADRYNTIVVDGAKKCPEMPGAEHTLKSLVAGYRLYVSSTTPESPLQEIICFRGWTGYFAGIFGYPRKKNETLRRILEIENVAAKAALVVGDGQSDREAARENGCPFLPVDAAFDFYNFQNAIENIQHIEE